MELTDDLVAIQGILITVIKTTGEFTKIIYRGGNEEKILKIIEEIQKHIINKNYIKDGKINNIFDKEMEDIVLFLAVNTKYKTPLQLEDYDHLIDIMPQLSKCVLANIVYGLDLCKYYSKVIEKLPLHYGIELIEEMIPCLKKSIPNIQLQYAMMFLRATAIKLSSVDIKEKDENDICKLLEVTNIILQLLTGLYPSHVKNLKAVQIYQHMGYTLLSLFELLLFCDKENRNLKKFIENVLKTCCSIIRNVTINVYCSWAEVKEDDEPLQIIVSGKAYEIVEEYQKYKEAKELVSMLGAIAKKPKTLFECIQAADTTVIIKNVNKNNQEQKAWFRALLGTPIFDNKDAMRCVATWGHLCDENDVTRLLNLSHQLQNRESKQLAIKCASSLNLDKLSVAMMRYFYENKFDGPVFNLDEMETQLKIIFNKTSGQTKIDDTFVKEMCLLMLQSPDTVLKGVYGECLRNKCYTEYYKRFFVVIKEIVGVNNFGVDTLLQAISINRLDDTNVDNYVALFSALHEIPYLSSTQIINKLLLPLLDKHRSEKEFEQLGLILQIFLGCSFKIPAIPEMTNIRWTLLNTMNDSRCTFLELNSTKQQTANYAVDVIKNLCELDPSYNFQEEHGFSELTECFDEFTNYYNKYLSSKIDITLLHALYSDFNPENYTEAISHMLRFLPRAVTSEWTSILQEIFFSCGSEKAMEMLTDIMILLCKVVHSQNPDSNTGTQVTVALKYCIQQYCMAVQNMQRDATLEAKTDITKNICRLIKQLPEFLKEEQGVYMINILSQDSLKSLANDREFVCSLISINNSFISTSIAQRMVD